MTDQIDFIIPVAPFEPLSIIEKSVQSLENVEAPSNYSKNIFYVIDVKDEPEDDQRVTYLKEETGENINAIVRTSNEGRRAGAINTGLEQSEAEDYITILDIDSRPGEDFLEACIQQLDENEDVFMSTCPRKVLNADQNFTTKMVEAEFDFFTDMQLNLEKNKGFNHFNGLISVLDASYLKKEKLDESKSCEDTEFTERAYLDGKRPAINSESYVGEQAVTNLSDLYNQKVRWVKGAVEGLRNYSKPIMTGDLSLRVKFTWLAAMLSPFLAPVASPLVFIYGLKFIWQDGLFEGVRKSVAFFVFTWIIGVCALVNIWKLIAGKGVAWKESSRENI